MPDVGCSRPLLDENEFLSPFGIRSLSRRHAEQPFRTSVAGENLEVCYWPAESESGMFGGNSNWRGPIWAPANFLIIDALRRYHEYYGDHFTVECPTGSGNRMTLDKVADELSRRFASIFERGADGRAAGLRRHREVSERFPLARLAPVLRIFPRRQRCRTGRLAPDGMDRSRRSPDGGAYRCAAHRPSRTRVRKPRLSGSERCNRAGPRKSFDASNTCTAQRKSAGDLVFDAE